MLAARSDKWALVRSLTNQSGEAMPVPHCPPREKARIAPVAEQQSKFYLRVSVLDKPGVLSFIFGILGKHNVSIRSCHQRSRSDRGSVPVVMITHEAREGDVRKALAAIDRAKKIVKRKTVAIRVEE